MPKANSVVCKILESLKEGKTGCELAQVILDAYRFDEIRVDEHLYNQICDFVDKMLNQLADDETIGHQGQRRNQPQSNMALEMLLRRRKIDVTVHGFRSSFRDWVGDETHFPSEVAEAALAHAVGSKTEQACRRGSALAKRRELMDAWAEYCGTSCIAAAPA